jgi:hypothetical protein
VCIRFQSCVVSVVIWGACRYARCAVLLRPGVYARCAEILEVGSYARCVVIWVWADMPDADAVGVRGQGNRDRHRPPLRRHGEVFFLIALEPRVYCSRA